MIFLLAAAAPEPALPAVVARVETVKSLDNFGSCFAATQDHAQRAWSFVPSASGGTFSNFGANGAAATYRLTFTEGASANAVRLFATPLAAPIAAAMEQCR